MPSEALQVGFMDGMDMYGWNERLSGPPFLFFFWSDELEVVVNFGQIFE